MDSISLDLYAAWRDEDWRKVAKKLDLLENVAKAYK